MGGEGGRQRREVGTPQRAWQQVERWALQPAHDLGMNGWEGSEIGLGACRSRPQAQGSAFELQRVLDFPIRVVS